MKLTITLLITLLSLNTFSQNVGINTTGSAPNNSAMLDVESTDKGMLIPRMTTAQRTMIATPATGLLVFDNTTTSFWFFNGTVWEELVGGVTSVTSGTGMTGGGTGNVTVNAVGDNGLTTNPDDIDLGGDLNQNTTINQGVNQMNFNLDGTGDFNVQDNGTTQFSVLDNGDIRGDNNTFAVDASTDRVGIGTTAPGDKLHVVGDILLTGGVRNIEIQAGDQSIQLDDANPTWNSDAYGGVIRFFGDGNLVGSKLEAGGLQLERRIQIKGGNPGQDKVLTSDATGNATWEDPFSDKMVITASFAFSEDDVNGGNLTSYGNFTGDDVSRTVTIPFNVTLGGANYNQVYISSNGFIEFGAGTGGTDLSNDAIPSGNHSNPLVAAYWDDLRTNGNGIEYGYSGIAPNRVFIITYDTETFSGSHNVDFQIQIHEGSNLINVKYFDLDPSAIGQGATLGYQGAGGGTSKAYPLGYNARLLDDNTNDDDPASDSWSICPVR